MHNRLRRLTNQGAPAPTKRKVTMQKGENELPARRNQKGRLRKKGGPESLSRNEKSFYLMLTLTKRDNEELKKEAKRLGVKRQRVIRVALRRYFQTL